MNEDMRTASSGTRRILIATGALFGAVCLLLILIYAADVLLVLFAGILGAVFLAGVSRRISRWTGLPYQGALAVFMLAMLGAAALFVALLAPQVADQAEALVSELTKAAESLRARVEKYPLGRRVLDGKVFQVEQELEQGSRTMVAAQRVFTSTLGALANGLIIFFVALYGASNPDLYRRGTLRLVPPRRRRRAAEVLDASAETLWGWLIGQLMSMTIIGVCTAIGLWALGIPLPIALGVLTALLTFIPNIGPLLSVIPPSLLALEQGPMQAGYVVALYAGLQLVESYLVTPLIQQHEIELPPVVTIMAQIFLGYFTGALGLLVATPLAALAMTLIDMLYVEDTLGDRDEVLHVPVT